MEENEIPVDVTNLSNGAVCDLVNQAFYMDENSTGKHDYYCGITNNVEENRIRHNVPHIAVFKCRNSETAAQIEEMLGLDYDIGNPQYTGNGGRDDSVFVYML